MKLPPQPPPNIDNWRIAVECHPDLSDYERGYIVANLEMLADNVGYDEFEELANHIIRDCQDRLDSRVVGVGWN